VHNRYHADVNGYFLCDRGRFGFHYINGDEHRLRQAGRRTVDGAYDPLTTEAAIAAVADALRGGNVIGIGSPRASLETNHALRTLVGESRFSNGLSASEQALNDIVLQAIRAGSAHIPTLTEMEQADAVLVLGEDVLQTAPRIALALRQAVRNVTFELGKQAAIPEWQDAGIRLHGRTAKSPLFAANVLPTDDADIATGVFHAAPDTLAQLGFAIAQSVDAGSAFAWGSGELSPEARAFVDSAAAALKNGKKPLIVAGTSLGHAGVLQAARAVAEAIRAHGVEPALCLVVPECNSLGASLQGGLSVDAALEQVEQGNVDTLVIAENDLYRRADPARVRAALAKVRSVIAVDSVMNTVVENANIVLPAAAFAESEGTYVNYETRAQRFYQVFQPKAPIAPSWRWLADIAAAASGSASSWQHVDDVVLAMDADANLKGVIAAAPNAAYRPDAEEHVDRKVPRQPHRYSGRTAMNANVSVHEPKQPVDAESPLGFTMEGTLKNDSRLLPYVWTPGWNSNQSVTRFQVEAGGALKGGEGGVRLINQAVQMDGPRSDLRAAAERATPAGELRAVPLWQVFGSDELSGLSAPIVERTQRPFVVLNPADAATLGVAEGEDALVSCGSDDTASLRVLVNAAMAAGHVGYARGLPGSVAHAPASLRVQADPSAARMIART
jgi:NADH-quinone oxidoreductase subunit G